MTYSAGTADQVALQEILGYLNFSSGASDPAFLRRLNELWGSIEQGGVPPEQCCQTARQLLEGKLEELATSTAAFRNPEQARAVLPLIFDHALPAYREHHRDLLFHQSAAELWRPFFVGRVAEAILTAGGPWDETERIVGEALSRLNDFLGHRPVAVLENHRHEPYPHERVRPVPLYIRGAGVAVGKYHDLIQQTLAILKETDRDLLAAAFFDLTKLDELALDPRAYDFNHPVNRRPNYHFGQWDPHLIDNQGNYRRFVVQQCTLDAVLARLDSTTDIPREQLLFEAGAVLAGTMLMAAGTSGSGPESHDSTVSLANLLPRIAQYRDAFYQSLFAKSGGAHRQRLEAEIAAKRQPFAGARQHLNAELARMRALQMQHMQLAQLFARLGFADAAKRQAEIVPAASARIQCELQCLLSGSQRHIDNRQLADAFAALGQFEKLLHRAIACGAVIDPTSILGFGGQFSLFPAVENSIPDPRADDLIDLVSQGLALYSRLWHEAATADDAALERSASTALKKLAGWWDRFATTTVSGVKHISGREQFESAQKVTAALVAWHKAGQSAGTAGFWRQHVDDFDSPQSYSRVIEVLLDQPDLNAAMALLINWLGEGSRVGLEEGPRSFYALAMRWLHIALQNESKFQNQESGGWGRPKGTPSSAPAGGSAASTPGTPRDSTSVLKLFDYLEANADLFWEVPQWQPGELAGNGNSPRHSTGQNEADADSDDPDQTDEDRYSAAYEDVVYRDSTGDGIDADMLEGPSLGGESNDELDRALQWLSARLAFLAMLAALWKNVALAAAPPLPLGEGRVRGDSPGRGEGAGMRQEKPVEVNFKNLPTAWLNQAETNQRKLNQLAAAIHKEPLILPSANYDALIDYDRRRLVRETMLERVVATIVATKEAELLLAAIAEPSSPVRDRISEPSPPGRWQGEGAVPQSGRQSADAGKPKKHSKNPSPAESQPSTQPPHPGPLPGGEGDIAAAKPLAPSLADRPQTVAMWSEVLGQNVAAIHRQWGTFLVEIAQLPLLYVPLSRGGEAGKMAEARGVQQTFRELLGRLPRLGLLRETCQLLRVARSMEKEHSPGPGAVTEFDRLFEIGYKAIVESVVESSTDWSADEPPHDAEKPKSADQPSSDSPSPREKGRVRKDSPGQGDGMQPPLVAAHQPNDPAIDAQLIDCLQQVTESLLSEWLSHSRTLRLSVLERISTPKAWQELVKFIQRYGHDLFTQQFFHLGNLRAILHQGVDHWLERLLADDDTSEQFLLLRELDHGLSRAEAKKHLSLILEAVIENYAEYRDYNATTTQSDQGEMLHILLDFLRLKVAYERIHWNLRPVFMAHDVLIRRGLSGAAELWRRAIAERTGDVADEQLRKLSALQNQTGVRLATVADRLGERFVRPLAVDRVRALVAPAAEESRRGGAAPNFTLLEQEAGELAQEPCGAGLDLPDWLEALEQEVNQVTLAARGWDASAANPIDQLPWVRLTWDEIQGQLTDWDTPPEIRK